MKTLTVIALLCAALTAQAQITTKHVSVLGNSIAEYERGDEHNIFPMLPVNNIFIHGHPGATCAVVRTWIVGDAFGTVSQPRQSDVVVLIDTTNDWQMLTFTPTLMSCLAGTISDLLAVKSNLQIVVLTTLPYVQETMLGPCNVNGDKRSIIENYNANMPALHTQFPNNVTVLDAWSPFVLNDGSGWGDPTKLTGYCGIHPGLPGDWSLGQQTLAAVYRDTVMGLLSH